VDIEKIEQEVLELLVSLDVTGDIGGDYLLHFAVMRAQEAILNDIKCQEIPDGLHYAFVCMSAGFYLFDKKAVGQLNINDLDLDAAQAKQIKEGDVQITFATASDGSLTPEARFDALIHKLTTPDPASLTRYRRLEW